MNDQIVVTKERKVFCGDSFVIKIQEKEEMIMAQISSLKKIEKLLNQDFEKQKKGDELEGWRGQWFKVRFLRVASKTEKIQFRLLSGPNVELMDPFDEVMKGRGFIRISEQEIGDWIAQVFTRRGKTYEFLQKVL